MAVTDAQFIAIVVGLAFLPPLLYAILLRNIERYRREPLSRVFRVFFFGAFISVIVALLLTGVVGRKLGDVTREYDVFKGRPQPDEKFFLVVLAAPLVEEFSKGLAVISIRRHIAELEDGIIYGAAAGLGFSAMENLFYEINSMASGENFVLLTVVRSLTSTFLHATTSGLFGYGIARSRLLRFHQFEIIPYYLAAVFLHGGFNAIASLQLAWGLAVVFLFGALGIRSTARRIRRLDRASTGWG